jgi:hypothetical protein
MSRFSLSRGPSGALRPCSRLCASRGPRLWPLSHSVPCDTIPIKIAWREGAAAQYHRVLSILRDTMDKTLFVRPTVCLDVISLVASSCRYNRGQIEHRVAQ